MHSLILAWMLARPWMPAPKCWEKSRATKLLLHLVFCVLESLCGPLEDRHRPSLVSVGMCQGGGVPHGTSARQGGLVPMAAVTQGLWSSQGLVTG